MAITKLPICMNKKGVNNDVDFWKDVQEFLKGQLPDDFQEKLDKYVTDKGYNSNECRLFKSMLTEAVGLYGTVMVIKQCSNEDKNEKHTGA